MDAGIVGSRNIGATAGPCLEFSAYLSRVGRADERTRTAYLCSNYEFACVHTSPYYSLSRKG